MKKRVYVGISLLLLSVVLLACAPPEKAAEEIPAEQPEASPAEAGIPSLPAVEESLPAANLSLPLTPCTAAWVCLSSSQKIYRYENCSLGERVECKLGCFNDECRKPSTCTPGFKCNGQYSKGFQAEDCSWVNEVKCEWGCKDAECLPKPNETTATSSSSEVSEETPPPLQTISLKAGEAGAFTVGDVEHTIKIYNMEALRVQLEVDGQRSNWIEEGNSFTFPSGVTITVVEILHRSPGSSWPSEIGYRVG